MALTNHLFGATFVTSVDLRPGFLDGSRYWRFTVSLWVWFWDPSFVVTGYQTVNEALALTIDGVPETGLEWS